MSFPRVRDGVLRASHCSTSVGGGTGGSGGESEFRESSSARRLE
jgi:hypothetical protein